MQIVHVAILARIAQALDAVPQSAKRYGRAAFELLRTRNPHLKRLAEGRDPGISLVVLSGSLQVTSVAEVPAALPTPLEAENAALRKKVRELEEQREILRRVAKYSAGETRW